MIISGFSGDFRSSTRFYHNNPLNTNALYWNFFYNSITIVYCLLKIVIFNIWCTVMWHIWIIKNIHWWDELDGFGRRTWIHARRCFNLLHILWKRNMYHEYRNALNVYTCGESILSISVFVLFTTLGTYNIILSFDYTSPIFFFFDNTVW